VARSRLFFITALLLSLLTFPSASAANPKYGEPCKKAGIEKTYNYITFVCLKVKGKLVWTGKQYKAIGSLPTGKKKQLPINTVPTPKPTPAATSTHTPTPTPTKFVAPVIPRSFEDLESHLSGIIYGAWLKSSQKIQESKSNLGKVNIFYGPNSPTGPLNPEDVFTYVSKLYSNFDQPKNVYGIQFGLPDVSWAQNTYNQYQDTYSWNGPTAAADICPDASCDNANAYHTANYDGLITFGISSNWRDTGKLSPRIQNGQGYAHEYVHTIQWFNAQGTRFGDLPPWMREGNADWAGTAAAFYSNYEDYVNFRAHDVLGGQYGQPLNYSDEWVTKFLNPNPVFMEGANNNIYWDGFARYENYCIGFMVNEIFTALKGPDAGMNLYRSVGKGKSFLQAFQDEFGLSWAEALPYISKTISKELTSQVKK
jgi:hypothetical protein